MDRRSSPRHRARKSRRGRRTVVLVGSGLALAAASAAVALAVGALPARSTSRPGKAGPETTSSSLPLVAPLTGLPAESASVFSRPAIDMKIDDDYAAKPQSGVNQADVVYEEVVEGGITRWLAVFQSHAPSVVGPVRSVRQTDADLVAPLGGLFAYSGGIPAFVSDVMATGVHDVGATVGDPGAYSRDPSRLAPDNLYTDTKTLWSAVPGDRKPPPPIFSFRTLGAPFGAQGAVQVGEVTVAMSAETTVSWQWDPATGAWERSEGDSGSPSPSLDASGSRISFTNVIVQYVPYHDTGFVDPNGSPVPDADTVGRGYGLVFSGGAVARVTWSKPTQGSVTTFWDSSGRRVALEPGNTWVEFVPTGQPAPSCTGGNPLAEALCRSVQPQAARTSG
jgi:hypothetical protein